MNDTAVEPDETFVTLDSVTSSTVTELGTPATATVTIRSQDQDTFIVDDADDAADAAINGVCDAPGADLCTLRAAIQEANANAVADQTRSCSPTASPRSRSGRASRRSRSR